MTKRIDEDIIWKSYKRESVGVSVEFVPKKGIIIWKMVSCSECRKDNIFSIRMDPEYLDYLKKLIENGKEELKKEELDKILKALMSMYPPKKW